MRQTAHSMSAAGNGDFVRRTALAGTMQEGGLHCIAWCPTEDQPVDINRRRDTSAARPAPAPGELPDGALWFVRLFHMLGAVLMGAGLIGVWMADLRSRQLRELAPFAEAVRNIAVFYDGFVVPGSLSLPFC